jgi:hypothetical protein
MMIHIDGLCLAFPMDGNKKKKPPLERGLALDAAMKTPTSDQGSLVSGKATGTRADETAGRHGRTIPCGAESCQTGLTG